MFNLLFVLAVQTKENGFYGTIYALTLHDCGFDHVVNPIRVFTCPLGYILSIHVALLIWKLIFVCLFLFMVLSLEGGS